MNALADLTLTDAATLRGLICLANQCLHAMAFKIPKRRIFGSYFPAFANAIAQFTGNLVEGCSSSRVGSQSYRLYLHYGLPSLSGWPWHINASTPIENPLLHLVPRAPFAKVESLASNTV